MRHDIVRFWRGELPLGRSFWTYAVFYGVIFHTIGTALALVLYATGAPGSVAGIVFFLPTLFSACAIIGVWRSANRFPGNPLWADLAKMGVVGFAVLGMAL
jgi:hypothetical protein